MIKIICWVKNGQIKFGEVRRCEECPYRRCSINQLKVCLVIRCMAETPDVVANFTDCPFPTPVDLLFEHISSGERRE